MHNDMVTFFPAVMPALFLEHIKKKYSKSSPRWQYNNSGNKDIKAATELLEDERDPDVIPAQFCKFSCSCFVKFYMCSRDDNDNKTIIYINNFPPSSMSK